VALWRMENGALTTDTIGGNTLTVIVTPTADTGDYKEGGASVDNDLNDGRLTASSGINGTTARTASHSRESSRRSV
jgi:hypothetical protein